MRKRRRSDAYSRTVIGTAKALELAGLRTIKAEDQRLRFFIAVDAEFLVHYCEHWSCTFPAVTVEHGLARCFRHSQGTGDLHEAPAGLDCIGRESAGGLPDQLRIASATLLDTLVHEYNVSCINGFYTHESSPPEWVAQATAALQR